MVRYDVDASLPTQLHLTRHANPVTDVEVGGSEKGGYKGDIGRTTWETYTHFLL